MAILNTDILNTDTTILLVPAEQTYATTSIIICNYDNSSSTTFDMHIIKYGDIKSNTNVVIKGKSLSAGDTYSFDAGRLILDSGDKIVVVAASPTLLSSTVSYLVV